MWNILLYSKIIKWFTLLFFNPDGKYWTSVSNDETSPSWVTHLSSELYLNKNRAYNVVITCFLEEDNSEKSVGTINLLYCVIVGPTHVAKTPNTSIALTCFLLFGLHGGLYLTLVLFCLLS